MDGLHQSDCLCCHMPARDGVACGSESPRRRGESPIHYCTRERGHDGACHCLSRRNWFPRVTAIDEAVGGVT